MPEIDLSFKVSGDPIIQEFARTQKKSKELAKDLSDSFKSQSSSEKRRNQLALENIRNLQKELKIVQSIREESIKRRLESKNLSKQEITDLTKKLSILKENFRQESLMNEMIKKNLEERKKTLTARQKFISGLEKKQEASAAFSESKKKGGIFGGMVGQAGSIASGMAAGMGFGAITSIGGFISGSVKQAMESEQENARIKARTRGKDLVPLQRTGLFGSGLFGIGGRSGEVQKRVETLQEEERKKEYDINGTKYPGEYSKAESTIKKFYDINTPQENKPSLLDLQSAVKTKADIDAKLKSQAEASVKKEEVTAAAASKDQSNKWTNIGYSNLEARKTMLQISDVLGSMKNIGDQAYKIATYSRAYGLDESEIAGMGSTKATYGQGSATKQFSRLVNKVGFDKGDTLTMRMYMKSNQEVLNSILQQGTTSTGKEWKMATDLVSIFDKTFGRYSVFGGERGGATIAGISQGMAQTPNEAVLAMKYGVSKNIYEGMSEGKRKEFGLGEEFDIYTSKAMIQKGLQIPEMAQAYLDELKKSLGSDRRMWQSGLQGIFGMDEQKVVPFFEEAIKPWLEGRGESPFNKLQEEMKKSSGEIDAEALAKQITPDILQYGKQLDNSLEAVGSEITAATTTLISILTKISEKMDLLT